MLELFFLNLPQKGSLTRYIGIQPPFNTRINYNSEALHAQECTHMNDIAFLLHPDLKKKKKIDLPTLLIFEPKG